MAELVIIRGLPGSGKSTRARQCFPNHLHYEPDHLLCDTNGKYIFDAQIWPKAIKFIELLTDLALAKGKDVVVSDVFCKLSETHRLIQIGRAHKSTIKTITCKQKFNNVHNVPLFVLEDMEDAFEEAEDFTEVNDKSVDIC